MAFGPYRVSGLIGRGGMGLVYRGVHEQTGEEVAVKTVRIRRRGMLHRIRREIQALARTRHPGLVRVIETGQSEGLPWYAMELLQGQSLHDRFFQARALEPHEDEPEKPCLIDQETRADFILSIEPEEEESSQRNAGMGSTATLKLVQVVRCLELPTPDDQPDDSLTEVLSSPVPQHVIEPPPDLRPPEELPPPEPIPEGDLRDFLILIARLCETLAYLHGEGIVHRDIKPQNVIIRPDGTPVLLDFGLASYFGACGRESLEVGGKTEGTPEYMSPEQILGEYVDARADLYSVGCILYEGVTGRVPFRGKDAGRTLQAHLRQEPVAPNLIRDEIPDELNALILKLLEKKPENRLGYARDIIAALDRLGCVEPLWSADWPSRDYLYRAGFVGRDATLAGFEKQVRRSLSRPGRCIFLRGQSGVGKTRFIMELARQFEQAGLTVATGECLPIVADGGSEPGPTVRATPLHPFRPFLQMVVDSCLERGPDEVRRLLGPGGGLLAVCEPSLSDLPGISEVTPCSTEEGGEGALQSSLIEALGGTLNEFGRTSPIVLFLDDLDWADALTLHFLALFHIGIWDAPNVAIVAAYRSEGGDEAIRDYGLVFQDATMIDIGPLEPGSVKEIIRGMLGSHRVDQRFVDHLAKRSGGNPFFVSEFLRSAVVEGMLRRDSTGCWRAGNGSDGAGVALDGEAFDAAIGMPETLHSLVVRRLRGLSVDARRMVELAAVVGREVDADLLESVESIGEVRALEAIEALVVAQVLEDCQEGRFRFTHDKLREVAYEQIPPERRRSLHRSVALAIEARLEGPDDRSRRSASLALHWCRSIADRRAEPGPVARALGYLEASIRQSVNAGLPVEAVEFGRAASRLLGVELPESPAEVDQALTDEFQRIERLLGARRPLDLLALPDSRDPEIDQTVGLLVDILPPAYLSNQLALFAFIASKNLVMILEHGLGPRSATVFAMAALIWRITRDDAQTAFEFARLAVEVDHRMGRTQTGEVLFLKSWFVAHWVAPLSEVLADLDRAAIAGIDLGDVLHSCYSHAGFVNLLAASGAPLSKVIEEADARIARIGRKVIIARFHCVLERQFARALAGQTEGPTSLSDQSFDESRDVSFICRTTNANQVGYYHVARLKLHYYQGEYAQAIQAAQEALAKVEAFGRQPAEVDLTFYRALALTGSGDSRNIEAARSCLLTLQAWRQLCEANFAHKAILIEAELAAAAGSGEALSLYEEAARIARQAGFVQHEALAHERAARYLASVGADGLTLLKLAISGYRAWGASALADRLEASSATFGGMVADEGSCREESSFQGPKQIQYP